MGRVVDWVDRRVCLRVKERTKDLEGDGCSKTKENACSHS